jgi:hypothetical protein
VLALDKAIYLTLLEVGTASTEWSVHRSRSIEGKRRVIWLILWY